MTVWSHRERVIKKKYIEKIKVKGLEGIRIEDTEVVMAM